VLHQWFSFLPQGIQDVCVWIAARFTGEGWSLTLGLIFMAVVIFLPGGLMEGARRIGRALSSRKVDGNGPQGKPAAHAAE
jgi:ABC-type branched-subunit amino acid transport system permease subunit